MFTAILILWAFMAPIIFLGWVVESDWVDETWGKISRTPQDRVRSRAKRREQNRIKLMGGSR